LQILYEDKDKLKIKFIGLVEELKDQGVTTRISSAGESTFGKKTCKERSFEVKFGFSRPRTPQEKDGRKFRILYESLKSVINDSGI
jgi:hypothetical protein